MNELYALSAFNFLSSVPALILSDGVSLVSVQPKICNHGWCGPVTSYCIKSCDVTNTVCLMYLLTANLKNFPERL